MWSVRAFKGPLRATESFYTGAPRQPQNFSFMSILKVENPCFMSIDMVCRLERRTDTRIYTRPHTHTYTHTHVHTQGFKWAARRWALQQQQLGDQLLHEPRRQLEHTVRPLLPFLVQRHAHTPHRAHSHRRTRRAQQTGAAARVPCGQGGGSGGGEAGHARACVCVCLCVHVCVCLCVR